MEAERFHKNNQSVQVLYDKVLLQLLNEHVPVLLFIGHFTNNMINSNTKEMTLVLVVFSKLNKSISFRKANLVSGSIMDVLLNI